MNTLSVCRLNTVAAKSTAAASSRSATFSAVRPRQAATSSTVTLANSRNAGFLGCRAPFAQAARAVSAVQRESLTVVSFSEPTVFEVFCSSLDSVCNSQLICTVGDIGCREKLCDDQA